MSSIVALITNVGSAIYHVKQHVEAKLSVFAMSDKKISELIYASHVQTDESFDEDSLFVIVETVLKRATQIVDTLVQGCDIHVENIQEKAPKSNFSVPLCTLKSINDELSCKAPGEEIAHKTTLAILNKLSSYSWEAKSMLTLAAFALEFGEFWRITQLCQSDQLTGQLAILKRVPVLIKHSALQKHRVALLELNNLVKSTMRVIAIFNEFKKLSAFDPKDVPRLSEAVDHMPVDVYWTILTIAACATKFNILISDEPDKPHDLAPYSQKIHFILYKLNVHLTICRRQLAYKADDTNVVPHNEVEYVFVSSKEDSDESESESSSSSSSSDDD